MIDLSKIKTQWDLSPLLENENQDTIDSKISLANAKWAEFDAKWLSNAQLTSDPKVMRGSLDALEDILLTTSTSNFTSTYFGLKSSLDEADPKVKAHLSKIEDATRENDLIVQRYINRISKANIDDQQVLLNSTELVEYRYLLEDCFEHGKYLLSDEAEKVLTLNQNTSYGNWVRMTSEFLSGEEADVLTDDGSTQKKNFSELFTLLYCKDKKVRDSSAGAINTILEKHAKVAEAELNSVLEYKKIDDLLRGYPQADSAFSLGNKVSMQVIDTVIPVITENYKSVHEFYELKAKLLGLEKLEYYERNVEYGELKEKIDFDGAVKLVDEVMSGLDSSFAEIFENFLYNGQVDVFTKKGKTHGAYMAAAGKGKPSYVLLNFDGRVEDAFTIAHEMGHAINHELIHKSQKALFSDSSLCLDESASTFFEGFVLDKISENMDDATRLTLLVKQLDDAVGTIFRQIACYTFERELHKEYRSRGFLTKEEIGEIFIKNMAEYCGPSVEMNAGSETWWVYWSHIRSYFYVFSYAFGFLVSQYLQKIVREDKSNIEKVKVFLSAGSSKSPEAVLKDIGIDINDKQFWVEGIAVFKNKLNEATALAKKLGKI